MNRLTGTFRALRNANFRRFYIGQGISLIGTWMQQLAMSWLVYRLTGSAMMLGVIGFASQIPTLVFVPLAGALADRVDKRKLLLGTQAFSMLQALTAAFLVLTGLVTVWQLIVLGVVLGIINAFDMPVRQSFVIEMIDRKEDLPNAIALNSSLFNAARLAGPTIAGVLVTLAGEGVCFLINGLSYAAVLVSLAGISVPPGEKRPRQGAPLAQIWSGTKYTFGFPPIRALIMLLALMSLAGVSFTVLMPVFAKTILEGEAHTLGMLSGAAGAGALIGALYLASRSSVRGLVRIIAVCGILFSVSLCLFSISRTLPVSLAVLVLTGFSMISLMASSNTVLQTIVDDRMRGRVMSFYTMAFAGMVPFGSLLTGTVAEHLGTQAAVFIGGCLCLCGAIVFTFYLPRMRELIRPIYVSKGIITEMARGIQEADSVTSMQEE
jgi:MFS family permease